jgi:Na+/H+ antiporter NhaD/arsenite permease-like protein
LGGAGPRPALVFFFFCGGARRIAKLTPAPSPSSPPKPPPKNSGDPPNIIIGTALSRYIGFVDFLIHMAPGAVLAFIACLPVILLLFRTALLGRIPNYEKVLDMANQYRITNWSLFWKCTYVLGMVLVGFLLHPLHHLDPAWLAVFGAVVLCVCSDKDDVEEVLHLVEWDTLTFLAALFIVVEAAVQVGLINEIGGIFAAVFGATPLAARKAVAVTLIIWVSAIASALMDNIPFTLAFVPILEYLAYANLGLPLPLMAWALGFGACLGGNGSLLAAGVNIVGASMLDRAGHPMSFKRWLRPGVPVTIVSVTVANAYMLLRYCLPSSKEYPLTPIV